ncbi:MAG: DUF2244 domain-containing protein [Pseudomonadota bacterium]
MPYEWVTDPQGAPEQSGAPSPDTDPPVAELHLWPYRSLPRKGFVAFIAGTASLLLLPLMAVIGSAVLWGLLPFAVAAVWAIWWALNRSYRDGEILERLRLSRDRIDICRHVPGRPDQSWEANPYWVRLVLHPTGGPVPQYLTLKGGSREVELGAFLTPDERVALKSDIDDRLRALR